MILKNIKIKITRSHLHKRSSRVPPVSDFREESFSLRSWLRPWSHKPWIARARSPGWLTSLRAGHGPVASSWSSERPAAIHGVPPGSGHFMCVLSTCHMGILIPELAPLPSAKAACDVQSLTAQPGAHNTHSFFNSTCTYWLLLNAAIGILKSEPCSPTAVRIRFGDGEAGSVDRPPENTRNP